MRWLILIVFASLVANDKAIKISPADARKIGQQIYKNECGGKQQNLVHWNDGEDFVSIGIGHFIWCSTDKCTFDDSFPALRAFLVANGAKVPEEFIGKSPWRTKLDLKKTPIKASRLRKLMQETIDLQTRYMVSRIKLNLPYMVRHVKSKEKKEHIKKQFNRLASSGPAGIYILVDYPHFKGIGVKESEGYKGNRWGLLQALENMQGSKVGEEAIKEFSSVVKQLLRNRVKNAPRKETQWLPGWLNRIDTYLKYK